MGPATGTLEIRRHGDRTTHSWNGNVDDRQAARAAFDKAVQGGGMLAVAFTSPGKGKQVRTFDDVETIERETGVVSVQVTPGIAGG